jgi:hypothetical protein
MGSRLIMQRQATTFDNYSADAFKNYPNDEKLDVTGYTDVLQELQLVRDLKREMYANMTSPAMNYCCWNPYTLVCISRDVSKRR